MAKDTLWFSLFRVSENSSNLFSAAACTWQKTLLTPQVCELAAEAGKACAQRGAKNRRQRPMDFVCDCKSPTLAGSCLFSIFP